MHQRSTVPRYYYCNRYQTDLVFFKNIILIFVAIQPAPTRCIICDTSTIICCCSVFDRIRNDLYLDIQIEKKKTLKSLPASRKPHVSAGGERMTTKYNVHARFLVSVLKLKKLG